MRDKLSRYFRRQLQKAGIFYQRFPTVYHLYKYIANKPNELQHYELEKICQRLKKSDNHKTYNQLLKQFVPEWDIDFKKAQFIGRGTSTHNINIYRKVVTGRTVLFEKVYYSKTSSPKKIRLLEEHFFKMIKDEITIPKVEHYYGGDCLTLIYFNYLDSLRRPKDMDAAPAIRMSKYFYRLSFKSDLIKDVAILPLWIRDFRIQGYYRNRIDRAKHWFAKHSIDHKKIEQKLSLGRHVFSHGDMKEKNIFEPNTLVDWDDFGIYPAGLEQAQIFYKYKYHYEYMEEKPLHWLRKHYKMIVPDKEWALFELGFLYFLYIFSINVLQKREYKNLEEQIARKLKMKDRECSLQGKNEI